MAKEIVGEIICRKRGDTAPDVINVLDPESVLDPKGPLNIAGFSYKMTVNTEKDPETGVGNEIVSLTGVITDAPNGEVEFDWSAAEADQTPDVYWYDIEQIDSTSRIKTIAKNQYIFFQDITKP